MNYKFTFQEDYLDKGKHEFTVSYRGSKVKEFITKSVKTHLKEICDFLHHFGWCNMKVTDAETGELIARGKFSCNAFSGRDELEFVLEKQTLC